MANLGYMDRVIPLSGELAPYTQLGFYNVPNWTYGNSNVPTIIQNTPSIPTNVIRSTPSNVINSDVVDAEFKDVTGKGLKGFFANSGWNLTGKSKLGFGNTNGKAGLTIAGKNLAPIANIGTGVYQGAQAIKGLSDISKNSNDRQKLLTKIRASAANNPMLSSYLTSDQMSQLNKIKRGYNDADPRANLDFGGMLGGIGKGALMGLAGGLPGILIGAIGGGINAGINSKNQAITSDTESLEGLYQALADAEAQYNRMKIPNFTGLGLQSRYTNQWV